MQGRAVVCQSQADQVNLRTRIDSKFVLNHYSIDGHVRCRVAGIPF